MLRCKCLGFISLTWGLLGLLACDGSRNKDSDRSGIEVGNPSITVSAEFQLAEGEPTYVPLARLGSISLLSTDVQWSDLRLPLREVRYYASYYYYMPTDPKEGALLWPSQGVDTLLAMNVLAGDTLTVNFQNMDIPSRSYLKEVGLQFRLSNWVFHANWCNASQSCVPMQIRFPDSLEVDIRYHHSQMERNADSLLARLPIDFHPQILLRSLDSAQMLGTDTIRILADSFMIEEFCQSFNGLRYFYELGVSGPKSNLLLAAAMQFDSIGKDRVLNGDFQHRGAHWVFLYQEGGLADTTFENGAVAIQIPYGGEKDFSVQWMQEDIELIKGRWYRLRFSAWSDIPTSVLMARVGRFHAPYDNLDEGNDDFLAALSTTKKTFEWEFKAKETNLFGRLEFNAGLFNRKVWIKDVSLIQVEE